jgi:hypothetical protein
MWGELMNSRGEVMSRVLKLFPKHVIKDYFKEEEAQKDALSVEVVKRIEDADIFEFARNNLDFTKQHVYFLAHDIKKLNDLPGHILTENTVKFEGEDVIEYYDLYDVAYKVYFQEPFEAANLMFKWPICIAISKSLIAIHFTILEKNIQSYFVDQKVLTTRKSIEEGDIITLITNDMGKYGTLVAYDLNRGIKELWKSDIIDALEVQYLKAKSTSKETMHEEYTFKQQYPELYEDAIQAPLLKVLFKFIVDKDEYCDHFTIEPSSGKLTFSTFSKEKEHHQNVIRKILEFN